MDSTQPKWFYDLHGGTYGPVSADHLQDLFAQSKLSGDATVWEESPSGARSTVWNVVSRINLKQPSEVVSPIPEKISDVERPASSQKSPSKDQNGALLGSIFILAAIGGAWWYFSRPSGFTDQDIAKMKDSIREEFSKRPGVRVDEVVILRETANKATGYVTISSSGQSLSHPCNATMDQNGKSYFWRCQ